MKCEVVGPSLFMANFITPPAGYNYHQANLDRILRGGSQTVCVKDANLMPQQQQIPKKLVPSSSGQFKSPVKNPHCQQLSSPIRSIIFSPTRHSRVDTKTKLKQLNEFVQESFSKRKRLKFD